MYDITDYTYNKAKQLGVWVRPSIKKGKKIDIYTKGGDYIASVGADGYMDYPNYLEEKGKVYADFRKSLYKLRHKKDISKKYSNGWWANELLW